MRSFQYKAKNQDGKIIEGILDTEHFEKAGDDIKKRGLELLSLEELREKITPSIFEALGKQEEEKAKPVKIIQKTEDPDDSPILFYEKEKDRSVIPEEKFEKSHREITELLKEHGEKLSERLRARLQHLDGKIKLLKEYPKRKQWWLFRWEVRKALKNARREIDTFHEGKLKSYDQHLSPEEGISYTDVVTEKNFRKKFSWKPATPQFLQKFLHFCKIIDWPDEKNEDEVVMKQAYESAWIELQKFSGVLMAFYLIISFLGVYVKRNFGSDIFFVRVYDALLFQQVAFGLFIFFGALSCRKYFFPSRVKSDAALSLLLFAVLVFVV